MSFINSSTTVSITAKLTPYGRKNFLANNANLVTHFAVGDSDSNYFVKEKLESGLIPDVSGSLILNNLNNNSASDFLTSNNRLFYDNLGNTKKQINLGNGNDVISDIVYSDVKFLPSDSLGMMFINVNDFETDEIINLTKSLEIPFDDLDRKILSSLTYDNGGYSDTALSGLGVNEFLIISLPSSAYGETIDGKSFFLRLGHSGGVYDIYGTYQRKDKSLFDEDNNINETSEVINLFGNNRVFLFSDQIKRPNNSTTKSWSDGYLKTKPFSKSGKQLFNLVNDNNRGYVVDKSVGYVNLDKGFVVISDQNIIQDLSGEMSSSVKFDIKTPLVTTVSSRVGVSIGADSSTPLDFSPKVIPIKAVEGDFELTQCKFRSLSNIIYKHYTCYLGVGEFVTSNNPTFKKGDIPRISEIFLLDKNENIVAIGKTDRHITKTLSEDFTFSVKLYL